MVLLALVILCVFFLVRKYIRFRKSLVEQESLLEELADLHKQVRQLMKEKDELYAMKVSQLGLNPEEFTFQYVDKIKEKFEYEDILSNEFVTIYKIVSDVNIDNLVLQQEEVSEARWFTKDELNSLRDELKVIPHIEEFNMIYNILGD